MRLSAKHMLIAGQFAQALYIAFAIGEGRVPKEERPDQLKRDFPRQIMLPDMLELMRHGNPHVVLLGQQIGWQNHIMAQQPSC